LLFVEAFKDEFQNYVIIEHGFTFHQVDAPPLQKNCDIYKDVFNNCDEKFNEMLQLVKNGTI
jgi:hydrogenase maturation factor